MTRAKSGIVSKNRHKKILKLAKGFRGRANSCYRVAIERVEKSLQYAYRDRRNRKRDFRCLWIQRINAAAREIGTTYSRLISNLKKSGVEINRKMLSDLAVNNKESFKQLLEQRKS